MQHEPRGTESYRPEAGGDWSTGTPAPWRGRNAERGHPITGCYDDSRTGAHG